MDDAALGVSLDDIRAAAARLQGHAVRTPLLNAPSLDAVVGRRIFVKAECLQKTGSFKFRGAFATISGLSPERRAAGILAFSSGNHAQGVALAAQMHGVPATIVMPADAPQVKIENTRSYGAEVVLYDRATQDRYAIGERLQAERGMELVRPFDDLRVIAGQGTVGLELAEDLPEGIDEVLVCCGGGGLTAGLSIGLGGRARPRPVEPEGFDDVVRSLATGVRQTIEQTGGSLCDAILTPSPGRLTLPIIAAHCGPGIVVSDDDALRAMALAWQHLRIVLEPGGAVALAAGLFHHGGNVAVVASGGNVDRTVFQEALSRFG